MYENLVRTKGPLSQLRIRCRDGVLDHCGDHQHFMRLHERHAALSVAGSDAVAPLAPLLFRRFCDSRTMFTAAEDLRDGGTAAGPNDLRLEFLSRADQWELCRALARAVRDGKYRPGPRRWVKIPKGSGRGYRELQIQNVEDRIVDRGLLRILQPVIDPVFLPSSFGFRPHLGTLHALAAGLSLARAGRRRFLITANIANAFDAFPHRPLLAACSQYLPEDIVGFIGLIIQNAKGKGMPQGSPMSPFLANIFLHHFLDQPWFRRHHARRLLRYADDLAVMASSSEEAQSLHKALTVLARSAGTPLKEIASTGIFDIRGGQSVTWLGFRLQRESNRLAVRISDRAWNSLGEAFGEAHLAPASPLRAAQAVKGWLSQMGPCFPFENQLAVARRIRATAAEAAFEELPSANELVAVWQRAFARWQRLYLTESKSRTTQPNADGSRSAHQTAGSLLTMEV